MSAMVLPELRAIFVRIPKCASTQLWKFFRAGRLPLFRRATAVRDGIGAAHIKGDFVLDLGETAASRRMKRDFFTATFVCEPVKRLISAYGTITHRGPRGGAAWMWERNGNRTRRLWAPPFTSIPRADEPRRFNAFVRDLATHGKELLWEADPRWLSNHGSSDIHGQAWHHARSIMYYLTASDSDVRPRRLDFVGRVEHFAADLQRLLDRLGVSPAELTPQQRLMLNDSSPRANTREGFAKKGPSGADGRDVIAANLSIDARRHIRQMYEQDFLCLNYSLP